MGLSAAIRFRPTRTRSLSGLALALAACFTLGSSALALRAESHAAGSWDRKAAAADLDQRNAWWMGHMGAMDHGTYCISCHTAFSYALARSALRTSLGEPGPSPVERQLLESVRKRVRLWREIQPILGDKER